MILHGYKKFNFFNFIILLKISQQNGPLQKKPSKYKNPQLIHMALHEGLVIKVYNKIIYRKENNTRTLSSIMNMVRFKKLKENISIQGWGDLSFCGELSFTVFPFLSAAPLLLHIFSLLLLVKLLKLVLNLIP
jgi:hypothetical protein